MPTLAHSTGTPLHLGYCTNVHPGGDLAALHRVVEVHAAAVRRHLGEERLGLGLWLGQAVVAALAEDRSAMARLAEAMAAAGVYPFTLNCFPYGNFQAGAVKRAVYTPDWTSPVRADYTVAAARLLVALAPPEVATATLSTLPLGWGEGWDAAHTEVACGRLVATAVALRRLADETGMGVRLCIEPEPGCLVETTAQAIDLFHGPLRAAARAAGEGTSLLDETLGLCFDCCHQAVAFEPPEVSLDALAAAGVVVGKVQLSCGLEVADPSSSATRAALASFDEPRFLHQVRAGGPAGVVAAADDLGDALAAAAGGDFPVDRPWRVHFHAPIHRPVVGAVATTQAELARAIRHLVVTGGCNHLEVETYTWSLLPERERPADDAALAAALAAEVAWAQGEVAAASGAKGAR